MGKIGRKWKRGREKEAAAGDIEIREEIEKG